jgi:hypothetical protein
LKKVILPIILVIVVIIGAVVLFGNGLSGRYEYVGGGDEYLGKMTVMPIGFSDYLEFSGNEVTYSYMVTTMTNTYEIKDGKIYIDYMGTTFTYDFEKSGNTIIIGETEWRKS